MFLGQSRSKQIGGQRPEGTIAASMKGFSEIE
jgi:hypothetical protein